ncbi:MAG: SHOCT domain-containing protein [Actinomycetota bacterium]|nr:SHOCT domain-containing protein [Actinomycetota bacterium]
MMVFGPLVMLVSVVVVLLGVIVASRFVAGGGGQRAIGCGCMGGARTPGRPVSGLEAPKAAADPLEIVRERYARGEIDQDELERSLDHLLASERPGRASVTPPR